MLPQPAARGPGEWELEGHGDVLLVGGGAEGQQVKAALRQVLEAAQEEAAAVALRAGQDGDVDVLFSVVWGWLGAICFGSWFGRARRLQLIMSQQAVCSGSGKANRKRISPLVPPPCQPCQCWGHDT